MSERVINSGNGTAKVLMFNNGYLWPTIHADWYDTPVDAPIAPPMLCFVIEKDGKYVLWDMGTREDTDSLSEVIKEAFAGGPHPKITRPMPGGLPQEIQDNLKAVYLSHGHWDHVGNPLLVDEKVPIYIGGGTKQGVAEGGLGPHVGIDAPEVLKRLQEVPAGSVDVMYFPEKGYDVFGDGSFVVVPAPGHCSGHSVAVARVQSNPDAYILLGGDSGHHKALYDPCPCHRQCANFSVRLPIHRKPELAKENIKRLEKLHGRPDTWVVIAHEGEVERTAPQGVDLSDWQTKGYKEAAQREREKDTKLGCYAK